jgi:hypothetical protein
MTVARFEERVSLRCEAIRHGMRELARNLESGDESQLIYWITQNELGSTVRPLRRHQRYAQGRLLVPAEARPLVDEWITLVKVENIRSILSLMHHADLACYRQLGFRNENLLDHLADVGFHVASCPYEDPHYKRSSPQEKLVTLLEVRTQALIAFKQLSKPVLIMCSSGIDRSAPVAAFIVETESAAHDHGDPVTASWD